MFSNFSLTLLKKYGWKEGDGLGKTNQGISKPIRANLKFNNLGIGYQEINADQDSKWANMYSSALSRITVESNSTVTVQKDATEDNLYKLGYSALSRGFRKSDVFIKDGLEINISTEKTKKAKKRKHSEVDVTENVGEKFLEDKKSKKKSNSEDITVEKETDQPDKTKSSKKSKNGKISKVEDNIEERENNNTLCIEPKSKKSKKKELKEIIKQSKESSEFDIKIEQPGKKSKKKVKKSEKNEARDDQIQTQGNKSRKKEKKLDKMMGKSDENETTMLAYVNDGKIITENTTIKKSKKSEIKLKKLSEKTGKSDCTSDSPEMDNSDNSKETSKKRKEKKKSKTELIDVDNLILPNSSYMTCHPSARFGLGMSGKLARIQKLYDAEKLANQMKNDSTLKAI